ncbi:MAG TPA: Rieske 2Fe-2S domain-containing protein [Candidatus Kapabacteria bacterium]|nr:Rieske 2Fe-2S domain-containing protein [Candidatus Kapabacteria bacterium]
MNEIYIDGVKYLEVCNSKDVVESKGTKIQLPDDDDFQVAIFRINGELICLDNICPHRHADKIYDGIIKDNNVTCPLHGWTYSLQTGENINKSQGLKSLKKYHCFEQSGKVYLEEPIFEVPKWRRC